jgi:flagellar motor switch protein FliG
MLPQSKGISMNDQGFGQFLGQIEPATRYAPAPRSLTRAQKAAVIVRFLISEGASIPLSSLPDQMQADLTQAMGQLRLIDRATLADVVQEFLTELEQVGLAFPGGLEGALSAMDGHLGANAVTRLRRIAGKTSQADPWDRLVGQPADKILPLMLNESIEVGAVILSKLPVPKAAELLGKMPAPRAQRTAYAVSQTNGIDPETVRRIGAALVAQLDAEPARAFDTGPVQRVGAILNVAAAATREDVMRGLQESDAAFADAVRKAIFTFVHIPRRVNARDIPKVIRLVDQPTLVTALVAASSKPDLADGVEFFLSNMSQRMAQGIREDMAARGRVKDKDAEEAMNAVVSAIRELETGGEIALIVEEEEE